MKVMANSIPKSGTHLLFRLLTSMGLAKSSFFIAPYAGGGRFSVVKWLLRAPKFQKDHLTVGRGNFADISRVWVESRLKLVRNGTFFGGHCVYTPELNDSLNRNHVRMVSIIRDPRDVAVSYMYYVKQSSNHFIHREYMDLLDDRQRLFFSIEGGEIGEFVLPSLGESCREFLKWQSKGGALFIRFEDLVGEKGGGSADVQRRTIERVSDFLDLNMSDYEISAVQENLFGFGGTFRKGQIGVWRSEFSEEHKTAAKEEVGELLTELGYEKDARW